MTMETLEGYEEERPPETKVMIPLSNGGDSYHEVDDDGDIACGGQGRCEYEVVPLREAIRKWHEPCNSNGCRHFRENSSPWHDKEKLIHQYHGLNRSVPEIAEEWDTTRGTIEMAFKRYDIEKRGREEVGRLNAEEQWFGVSDYYAEDSLETDDKE